MYHSLSSSAHIVSSTVSTVRAALELKSVFTELEKAEKSGEYCDNDKTSCSVQRGDTSVTGCVDCMRKKKKDKDKKEP